MTLLSRIVYPQDLCGLSKDELTQLAGEIRSFLVSNVSRTGGHLGPNLGVVELTIALHRVFDSPNDPIVFDTGHQSYVHKILTGRASQFPTLRQAGGLSGYPSRSESEHDWVENSHASTALSWAEGMAKAFRIQGQDRTVVAFVGDGSLTGGMAWEALNNIAAQDGLKLVIVVNDNGRSYTPTVGGLANHLSALRTDHRYEKTLSFIKRTLRGVPLIGRPIYDLLHGLKAGIKDWLAPQGMFADLGIKYLGPIDGHDITAVINSLEQAKQFGAPVIVHCITRKGNGFAAAENNKEDHFHAVGKINEFTGEPLSAEVQATWTDAFAESIVTLGGEDERIVALTAAMLHPTGLARFAAAYPERTFDVGIAEQHAVTSAAGIAAAGLHPVFAVYATFLNRAFDQLLMDVAMHKAGVTFVLDRAGVTGPDGASHHGMWDVSLANIVPGTWLGIPRDQPHLDELLRRAVTIDDAPTIIRISKEKVPDPIPAVTSRGEGDSRVDVLRFDEDAATLIIGFGQLAGLALEVAERLSNQGISCSVAHPLWALPLSTELIKMIGDHEHVVVLEDNLCVGGLAQQIRALELDTHVHAFGLPREFLPQGTRDQVLTAVGLTAKDVARALIEHIASSTSATSPRRAAQTPQ